jgi:protein SCO1
MDVRSKRLALKRHVAGMSAGFAVLVVAAATLAGCGSARQAANPPSSTVAAPKHAAGGELYGLVPEPMPRKPNVTLTDTSGKPFDLASATRGKLTYLYFGYTHCPNACPVTMTNLSYAIRLQSPAIRRQIQVVFVTVDPRRDTRSVLRMWLNHYSHSFVGLTGSLSQIAAAERAAGVPPAPHIAETGTAYSVPHSSILFAYSPDDRSHVIYSQGFSALDYAHDMPLLLKLRG